MPLTEVLSTRRQVEAAISECRALGLPLHRDRAKNWDALGAVECILRTLGPRASVLDAGAAPYSTVLPWLRIYGLQRLVGNNLELSGVRRHGVVRFERGDITGTSYRDGEFDAVTCLSVIEHGVPFEKFLAEAARIIRSNGLLIVSTDFDVDPPDSSGYSAFGIPVKIFNRKEIVGFVDVAARVGFELMGTLEFEQEERPVHWKGTDLDYTFIRMTFRNAT